MPMLQCVIRKLASHRVASQLKGEGSVRASVAVAVNLVSLILETPPRSCQRGFARQGVLFDRQFPLFFLRKFPFWNLVRGSLGSCRGVRVRLKLSGHTFLGYAYFHPLPPRGVDASLEFSSSEFTTNRSWHRSKLSEVLVRTKLSGDNLSGVYPSPHPFRASFLTASSCLPFPWTYAGLSPTVAIAAQGPHRSTTAAQVSLPSVTGENPQRHDEERLRAEEESDRARVWGEWWEGAAELLAGARRGVWGPFDAGNAVVGRGGEVIAFMELHFDIMVNWQPLRCSPSWPHWNSACIVDVPS